MPSLSIAYETIPPTTWAYLSSLLMIALFFKFNRFWSVRNLDLFLIVLLAPGLLMVERGRNWDANQQKLEKNSVPAAGELAMPSRNPLTQTELGNVTDTFPPVTNVSTEAVDTNFGATLQDTVPSQSTDSSQTRPAHASTEPAFASPGRLLQRWGYIWLFAVGGILMIRMLVDSSLVRKPLLDPNLTSSGLIFLGLSLMTFLFANIIITEPTSRDLHGARKALKLLQRQAADETELSQLREEGPGYWLFNLFPVISTFNSGDEILETNPDEAAQLKRYVTASKILAIASQVLIVLGLIFFCYFNYGNFSVGVGVATIYLMLPYTAMFTGYTLHALPAALLLGALVSFRIPWLAGFLVGLATGVSYYPIFLLPLWSSFYWERGVRPFLIGVGSALGFCILGLAFTSPDLMFFFQQLRAMFGFLLPRTEGLEGIWELGWNSWYRLPIIVAHIALAVSFVFWPMEKNIGTLVSCTAALMIAVQFWLGVDGALTMAWYLPFVLLASFRPNLNGRTAVVELNRKRRSQGDVASEMIV